MCNRVCNYTNYATYIVAMMFENYDYEAYIGKEVPKIYEKAVATDVLSKEWVAIMTLENLLEDLLDKSKPRSNNVHWVDLISWMITSVNFMEVSKGIMNEYFIEIKVEQVP